MCVCYKFKLAAAPFIRGLFRDFKLKVFFILKGIESLKAAALGRFGLLKLV